jgi:hypothetical protein
MRNTDPQSFTPANGFSVRRVRSDLWTVHAPSYIDTYGPTIGSFETREAAMAARERAMVDGGMSWESRFLEAV